MEPALRLHVQGAELGRVCGVLAVRAEFSHQPCSFFPLMPGHSAGAEGEGSEPLQPRAGERPQHPQLHALFLLVPQTPNPAQAQAPLPSGPRTECTVLPKFFFSNSKILVCWGSFYFTFLFFLFFAYLFIFNSKVPLFIYLFILASEFRPVVSQPGIEPMFPALGTCSLNHWTPEKSLTFFKFHLVSVTHSDSPGFKEHKKSRWWKAFHLCGSWKHLVLASVSCLLSETSRTRVCAHYTRIEAHV